MLVFASEVELEDFTGEPAPVNARALLRRASLLVSQAARFGWYDITPAGAPADPDVAEAFRDATCLQVSEWVDAGVNPSAGGVSTEVVASESIDGASVSFAVPTVAQLGAVADELCEPARIVLADTGIFRQPWLR